MRFRPKWRRCPCLLRPNRISRKCNVPPTDVGGFFGIIHDGTGRLPLHPGSRTERRGSLAATVGGLLLVLRGQRARGGDGRNLETVGHTRITPVRAHRAIEGRGRWLQHLHHSLRLLDPPPGRLPRRPLRSAQSKRPRHWAGANPGLAGAGEGKSLVAVYTGIRKVVMLRPAASTTSSRKLTTSSAIASFSISSVDTVLLPAMPCHRLRPMN